MTTLGPTSDFTSIALRYDATRDIPEAKLRVCYARFVEQGLLPAAGVVLDAGCGTGQASLPLAAMGYEVRGYDISPAMVSIAQAKCAASWNAHYAVADARALPSGDASVDAVVVSKLLQHIQDWPAACRELLRVLRPGGSILVISEHGAFGNAVRRYFSQRADQLGHRNRMLGLTDRKELVAFFLAHGCDEIAVDVADLCWTKEMRYGDALDQFRERLFAEFWYLPPDVYDAILADAAAWVTRQPLGGQTVERLTPYLGATTFRKRLHP